MAETAYLIDSSVFIAFYIKDDSCHQEAVELLSEIDSGTMLLHTYVIQEVVTVLTYKANLKLANQFISDVENANNVSILPADVVRDIHSFQSLGKRVSFTDSTLLATATQYRLPLVTFDKQLRALMKRNS